MDEEEEGKLLPHCCSTGLQAESIRQRRDLAHLEELAKRARKAESAGFQLSQPGSPQLSSSRSGSGSRRSNQGSQRSAPRSATNPRSSAQRSPLPLGPVNADYYNENAATAHGYSTYQGDPFSDRQSVSTDNSQSTNIIPIKYIPPSKSDDTLLHAVNPPSTELLSEAARTLDAARQNLFRPKQTPPPRPPRSPDLDLRLSAPNGFEPPDSVRSPDMIPAGQTRESYLSATSGTPSFLSGGSYDVHTDAPRIYTSKQVQMGRLQQAEVVQFGHNEQLASQSTQYLDSDSKEHPSDPNRRHLLSPASTSPLSPGSQRLNDNARVVTRLRTLTLTPTSRNFQQEDLEEGLISEAPSMGTSTDLRFSMGSLAYDRNSVSTMGTSRYLARPDASASSGRQAYGPRESMFSTKSDADSVLGAFPMIPPAHPGNAPTFPRSDLPQSTSVSTLDHQAGVLRPTPVVKPLTSVRPSTSGTISTTRPGPAQSRPGTATDSFLGTFPFVPPNMDDYADHPSAGVPETAMSKGGISGRSMAGMSTNSEGLGGFDFSFGTPPPLPGRESQKR